MKSAGPAEYAANLRWGDRLNIRKLPRSSNASSLVAVLSDRTSVRPRARPLGASRLCLEMAIVVTPVNRPGQA